MIIQELYNKNLIHSPHWLHNNCHFLTIVGSTAYGVENNISDMDMCGICIPPRELTFPQTAGKIFGFDKDFNIFEQWQQHHVNDQSALGGKGRNYDITIYNIIKFFHECTKGNPNMIDSLFTNRECILHCTHIGNIIKDNRKLFLAKHLWKTYKGYAYSQSHKMDSKKPGAGSKRAKLREKHGFDSKFGYNLVRLIDTAQQIFTTGDIDLMQNREQLKAIKRGEWTLEQVKEYVSKKEKILEEIHIKSNLPQQPDIEKIREVLLQCLEHHYGDLSKCIVVPDRAENLLRQVKQMIIDSGY